MTITSPPSPIRELQVAFTRIHCTPPLVQWPSATVQDLQDPPSRFPTLALTSFSLILLPFLPQVSPETHDYQACPLSLLRTLQPSKLLIFLVTFEASPPLPSLFRPAAHLPVTPPIGELDPSTLACFSGPSESHLRLRLTLYSSYLSYTIKLPSSFTENSL